MPKAATHGIPTAVRALCRYDPLYTPQNLWRTRRLMDQGFVAKPWFKGELLHSVIRYTFAQKSDISFLAFKLLRQGPTRIPQPALLELVRLQRYFQNDELVLEIWNYLTQQQQQHPDHKNMNSLPVPLSLAFLRYFGPKNRFRELAREIADQLASSPHIDAPLVALAVTRTRISAGDFHGAAEIATKVRIIDRPLAGALLVAYAALGDDKNVQLMMRNVKNGLQAPELGGIIRNMAHDNLQHAVDFLEASDADDNTKQLAFLQLLNRAIASKNRPLFDEYSAKLRNTANHSEGVLMGLAIKWHVQNGGTFDQAKLEYQLKARTVHQMHRISGFKHLCKFSRTLNQQYGPSPEREAWLANESKLFRVEWSDLAPRKDAADTTKSTPETTNTSTS